MSSQSWVISVTVQPQKRHLTGVEHTGTATRFYFSSKWKHDTSGSSLACATGGISFQKNPSLISTDIIQQCCDLECFSIAFAHLLRFPSPCFSFTSADNVAVISFQGGYLSSHQAGEQRGGDGGSDSAPRRYLAEPISGLHSWSSSFTCPLRQYSLWDSLKEKMGGTKVLVIFAHIKKHLKSYLKDGIKQNETEGKKDVEPKKKKKKNMTLGEQNPNWPMWSEPEGFIHTLISIAVTSWKKRSHFQSGMKDGRSEDASFITPGRQSE